MHALVSRVMHKSVKMMQVNLRMTDDRCKRQWLLLERQMTPATWCCWYNVAAGRREDKTLLVLLLMLPLNGCYQIYLYPSGQNYSITIICNSN
eukprot:scaffold8316_cov102-Skeletonema_dohrnii-CCMP3373.AAC.2